MNDIRIGDEIPPELLTIEAEDRKLGLYRADAIKAAGYVRKDSRRLELTDPELSGLLTFWVHPDNPALLVFLKRGKDYTYVGIARKQG